MEDNLTYPTADKIIEYNMLALEFFRIKKADKAKVLSRTHILDILDGCKTTEGDIYDNIEDIWPDYPTKEDFFFNEDEY